MIVRRKSSIASTLRTVFGLGLLTIGFLATLGTLLGFLGSYYWAFDMLSSFRLQYAIVLLVVGLAYFFAMGRTAAFIFIGVGLVNVALIVPLYLRTPAEAHSEAMLRIASVNVQAGLGNQDQVLTWLSQTDADLVMLLESTAEWETAIAAAGLPYEIQGVVPDDRRYGITVLGDGTAPTDVFGVGAGEDPLVRVEAEIDSRTVVVYGVHPRPGNSQASAELRDGLLEELAGMVEEEEHPVVVIGDFNATPWSAAFRKLQADAQLVNSQDGFGLQPTWPTTLPLGLTIPIDHMLHTADLTTAERATGPDIGSDHLPLIVGVSRAVS